MYRDLYKTECPQIIFLRGVSDVDLQSDIIERLYSHGSWLKRTLKEQSLFLVIVTLADPLVCMKPNVAHKDLNICPTAFTTSMVGFQRIFCFNLPSPNVASDFVFLDTLLGKVPTEQWLA